MLSRFYYFCLYYLSWLVFGLVGVALNVGCACFLPFRHATAVQRRARAAIRMLFDLWVRWLNATKIVRVRWHDFPAQMPTGTVYIANHPTLIDATLLLSRLPDAICIFKPTLLRNPVVGPAAVLANYAAGESGVDVVRDIAAKLATGHSLLVFPEGTRTQVGTRLGPLKPGFALIASRANARVQLLTIRSSPGLTRRGKAWWKLPQLPGWVDITFDRSWQGSRAEAPLHLAHEVEAHLLHSSLEPVA